MGTTIKITELFGAELAAMLAGKIRPVFPAFNDTAFIAAVERATEGKTYTRRIEIIADELYKFLPRDYPEAVNILTGILGPENPNETGMFKHYWWIMPVGKFIDRYGLDYFELSMDAIAEVTRRNTGEYAVRPYIRKYPGPALKQMKSWALSDNFHLRRLSSEGLRHLVAETGVTQVVYGSDIPYFWPDTIDIIVEAPFLSDADKEAILGGNLKRMLRI